MSPRLKSLKGPLVKIDVISLFPEMIDVGLQNGVIGQSLKKGIFSYENINPREFSKDLHKTVDDRPFGGGDGMIMMAEPLSEAIQKSRNQGTEKVIYLSPQGKVWNDSLARDYSRCNHLTFVCGRYGGIDQRLMSSGLIDEEISIGDYVLSGGELGALVLIDSLLRMKPGVLGHKDSPHQDSFSSGLLEAPQFTRPQRWQDLEVPAVLMSGHHGNIQEWRESLSALVTLQKRPELFAKYLQAMTVQDKKKVLKKIQKIWNELSEKNKQELQLSLSLFQLEDWL